jgi:hypothetical protein
MQSKNQINLVTKWFAYCFAIDVILHALLHLNYLPNSV